MRIVIPRTLETDIMSFVDINKIDDVNAFLVDCLRKGFNISKYGTSPMDNFNKENKPFEYGREEDLHITGVNGEESQSNGSKTGRKRRKAEKEESNNKKEGNDSKEGRDDKKESGEQKEEGKETVVVKPKRRTIKIIKN